MPATHPPSQDNEPPTVLTRRPSDNRILASEIRYRRLFETAKDGILILNATTGVVEEVNPFLTKLLGLSTEEVLGKRIWELGSFQIHVANREKFEELQRNEYVRYDHLPLEAADGRRIDVEFVSNVYEEDGTRVIQCNIRDISAHKAAERALRLSEERFKFVARAVSDAVWDWDLETSVLWWNEGFRSTFGYVDSEIEPGIVSWTGRIHPDDVTRVVEGIHAAIALGPETWSADYRFRRKDGSYAAVQDRGFIVRDAAGRGTRVVGGIRDLTEQRKLETQFLRAQRMESIGTLAGGIAHDMNNVLAPILMSIELLKLDSANDAGRTRLLDTIHLSCRRGADLMRQVLSYARGVDGQRVALRVRVLIDELEAMIGETFPRNIRIVTSIADDLWPVTGDPTQLHQVLLNLAVNARDAMPQGGTLPRAACNLLPDAPPAGAGPMVGAGPHVLLQLTDSGRGIPSELRERIFEPFFTTKELGQGTGLGLSTVHAIVKSHGGFVSVESEIGHGTTFSVHLPAEPAQLPTGAPLPSGTELPRGQGELVLVVDDEQSIREITADILETFGYHVITAQDGTEAVALFAARSDEIALVLTDMMMPVMDGATAIQVMVRIHPGIRIIAASGLGMTEYMAKATSAGVRYILTKPYSTQTLLQLVHEVISGPAPGHKKTPPTFVVRR